MAEFPCLPLWTDAYLADTGHLSDAEHGIYLQLLIQCWRAPGQKLPNDDAWLARKFSRTINDVQETLRPVLAEFFTSDGNWLSQKRLSREFKAAQERSAKQSARAKARWAKNKDTSRGNASAGNARNGNASTSTSLTHKKKESSANAEPKKVSEPIPKFLDRTKGNGDGPTKRRKRFPANWQPTGQGREYAVKRGMPVGEIPDHAAHCVNHHSGKGNIFADLDAAWRTWCDNYAKWPKPGSQRYETGGIVAATRSVLAANAARGQGNG